jgi:Peptide-N-glycosidase F, C terminal
MSGAAGEAGGAAAPLFEGGVTVLERAVLSSDAGAEYQQLASVGVDFGDEPVARATLRVRLESPCYPFEGWKTQTTSPGHFWPDACDAFDRLFLISLDGDEGGVGGGGEPGIELTRAITPFGGPLAFETELTDVVNGLHGEHTLRIEIPTYSDPEGKVSGSKGSWIVSANLLLEPGPAPREVLAVVPLVFTSLTTATPEPFDVEVPEGATSARLEYRATGHGQGAAARPACIGPAEEFCHRSHVLALDGAELGILDPWRTDCRQLCTLTSNDSGNGIEEYCLENPCGAIQSVRASRANWCPGSVTPPFVLENAELGAPGPHELSLSIDELVEGGNWLVSATFFAFR